MGRKIYLPRIGLNFATLTAQWIIGDLDQNYEAFLQIRKS